MGTINHATFLQQGCRGKRSTLGMLSRESYITHFGCSCVLKTEDELTTCKLEGVLQDLPHRTGQLRMWLVQVRQLHFLRQQGRSIQRISWSQILNEDHIAALLCHSHEGAVENVGL
uniref:Uncharacterized protein n=1 Tax=Opuntia streptacantha TaxID=393608 RepID=A0A7C8ZL85_OPUST